MVKQYTAIKRKSEKMNVTKTEEVFRRTNETFHFSEEIERVKVRTYLLRTMFPISTQRIVP